MKLFNNTKIMDEKFHKNMINMNINIMAGISEFDYYHNYIPNGNTMVTIKSRKRKIFKYFPNTIEYITIESLHYRGLLDYMPYKLKQLNIFISKFAEYYRKSLHNLNFNILSKIKLYTNLTNLKYKKLSIALDIYLIKYLNNYEIIYKRTMTYKKDAKLIHMDICYEINHNKMNINKCNIMAMCNIL